MEAIVKIICNEPEGDIERSVYPLIFTPENLERFYKEASKFPTIFGRQYISFADFMSIFFSLDIETGKVTSQGMFYVIDDFIGVFYITDIRWPFDAEVHYTFFDRRHHGRVPLVRAMLKHVFKLHGFYRLSVEIPNYIQSGIRRFIEQCGFALEGKRRQCVDYKGQRFDSNLYGILDKDINGTT